MKSMIPLIAIGLGVLLLIGSALWSTLYPTTSSWTDEKSRQLSELGNEAQKRNYIYEVAKRKPNMSGGKNPAVLKEEYDKAMTELTALRDEFNSANDAPKAASSFLKWSGISFLGIGIISWMVFKEA